MPHAMSRPLTLSIVIPVPGDVTALEETLLSVLENRPEGSEVVVALGCDYDDPWGISEEVRFVRAASGAGLVDCVNAGIAASQGDVVHLLAAGWRATPGWTDGVLGRFEDGAVGAVVPLGVAATEPDRVVSAGVRYRRGGRRVALTRPGMWTTAAVGSGADRRVGARRPRWPVVGPVLEAGFWLGAVVRDGGPGFSRTCGERLADVDMAVDLAARGLAVEMEETSRIVVGVELAGERGFRAGLHGERLFWRSLAGRALVPSLLLHGVEVLRHAVASAPVGTVPMLLGRLLAVLQVGSYLPRYRQLSAVLSSAVRGAASAGETSGRTLRIDEGREELAGPRRRPRDVGSLRKSA